MRTDNKDEDARRRLAAGGGMTAERFVRWLAGRGELDLLAQLRAMRRAREQADDER